MSRLLYGQLQLAKIGAAVAANCYKYWVAYWIRQFIRYKPTTYNKFMMPPKKNTKPSLKKGKSKIKGGDVFEGPPGELDNDPMDVDPDSDTECVAAAAEKKTMEKDKKAAKAAKPATQACQTRCW